MATLVGIDRPYGVIKRRDTGRTRGKVQVVYGRVSVGSVVHGTSDTSSSW